MWRDNGDTYRQTLINRRYSEEADQYRVVVIQWAYI